MESADYNKESNSRKVEDFKIQKLKEARASEIILSRFNPDYKNTPFVEKIELIDVYYYYKAISAYSFISEYRKPASARIYSIDIAAIINALNKIESDPRVHHFEKIIALQALCLYCDLRIQFDFLSRACHSVFDREKEGNWVYATIRSALIYKKDSTSKRFQVRLQQMKDEHFFLPLKTMIDDLINLLSSQQEIKKEELEQEISSLLLGDLRMLEKNIFPILYSSLIIKRNIVKNDKPSEFLGKPSPTKRDLLFDIFPIIMPNRLFETKEDIENAGSNVSKYDGTYSNYRIATVKTIIGQ